MLRGLFARGGERGRGRRERDARLEAAERVKALARAALALPPDAELTANEIECLDPGCPGVETVVLVMRPGEPTHALKIAKPLEAVTEQDLREARSSGGEET